MRILLLSFYYPPDIGPGPLRAKALVDSLMHLGPEGLSIHVMTTKPNRYHSHLVSTNNLEEQNNLYIRRFAIPKHESGMYDQAISYYYYARAVHRSVAGQQWDIVIATSSRLFTASLGAFIATRCKAKLYLDIRDIFSETINDVLRGNPLKIVMPILKILEFITYRTADRINIVSPAFLTHIKERAPNTPVSIFMNGVDPQFIQSNTHITKKNERLKILYVGNIGEGQGLQHILPEAAEALKEQVIFELVGDGSQRKKLAIEIRKRNLTNIQIFSPVPRHLLNHHYNSSDILFLHLNNHSAFDKVIPSKIFEYAATGKPILAGVRGYASEFLRNQVPGVEIFDPCDITGFLHALSRILNGPKFIDRRQFCMQFSRNQIMNDMAQEIISMTEIK